MLAEGARERVRRWLRRLVVRWASRDETIADQAHRTAMVERRIRRRRQEREDAGSPAGRPLTLEDMRRLLERGKDGGQG